MSNLKKIIQFLIEQELGEMIKEDTVSDMYVVHVLLDEDEVEYAQTPIRRAVLSLKRDDVLYTDKKALPGGQVAYHFYVGDKKKAKILNNLLKVELRQVGIKGFESVIKQQFGGMVGFMRPDMPKLYKA